MKNFTRLMQYSLLLFLLVLNYSCTVQKNNKIDKILGIWTEHWDKDSDVTYVDTLRFYKKNNKLQIECINDSVYIFSQIKFDGSSLTFTSENICDPNERFFIYYTLTLINKDLLKGGIVNSRKQKVGMRFEKLK